MARFSNNLRGSVLMMAAMAAFVFNDASMKALSDEFPLFQAIFLRGLLTSVLMGILAWRLGVFRFRFTKSDWLLIAIRATAEVIGTYFFVTAIFNMPLANATAILQALPLTVALAGAVFLGEAVGWRRMAAILVGFVGVLLIVQPGAEGFGLCAYCRCRRDGTGYRHTKIVSRCAVIQRCPYWINRRYRLCRFRLGWRKLGRPRPVGLVPAGRGINLYHWRICIQRHDNAGWRNRRHRTVSLYQLAMGAVAWVHPVWGLA